MTTVVGVDAEKWAEAFYQINPHCNIDRETMFGWFCNLIMAGIDDGKGPINGDHAAFLIERDSK